jgi:hypothetical protein
MKCFGIVSLMRVISSQTRHSSLELIHVKEEVDYTTVHDLELIRTSASLYISVTSGFSAIHFFSMAASLQPPGDVDALIACSSIGHGDGSELHASLRQLSMLTDL